MQFNTATRRNSKALHFGKKMYGSSFHFIFKVFQIPFPFFVLSSFISSRKYFKFLFSQENLWMFTGLPLDSFIEHSFFDVIFVANVSKPFSISLQILIFKNRTSGTPCLELKIHCIFVFKEFIFSFRKVYDFFKNKLKMQMIIF